MSAIKNTDVAKEAYGSGKYTDLTVKCGDFTTQVHKVIVCTQSAWFAKAVDDERFLEGRSGVVEFKEESPRTVQLMLQFLYTGDYALQDSGGVPPDEVMGTHLDVYALADLLQHGGLRKSAELKFGHMLERHLQDKLFMALIIRAYEIAPPGQSGDALRKVVMHCTARRINEIYKAHPDFGTAVQSLPQLSSDLLYLLSAQDDTFPTTFEPTRLMKCWSCGKEVYLKNEAQLGAEVCPWGCEEDGEPCILSERRGLPPRYLFCCSHGHAFQVTEHSVGDGIECFVCHGNVSLL